jgi:hypothetical protein
MARATSDQLGRYAEAVAWAAFVRPLARGTRAPLFRTTYLGDKYPTVDFLVDLVGPTDRPQGFFFVQVKGSASSPPAATRLAIDVPKDRFNALAALAAPTYLIGVDLVAGVPYVVVANRRRRSRVSSISKAFPLTDDSVKVALFREVLAFWKAHKPLLLRTGFKDV